MVYSRDPVSELFDASARRLLTKAQAQRGQWVEIWLPDPGIRQRSRLISLGIGDLTGPDPVPKGGGVDAKTRWARGFVRAVYYQWKWYSKPGGDWGPMRRRTPRNAGGLRIQVGRHVPGSPQFDPAHPERGGLPPRRRVRVQLAAGGKAKAQAVARLADRDRIYTDTGQHAGRWADPGYRDWA